MLLPFPSFTRTSFSLLLSLRVVSDPVTLGSTDRVPPQVSGDVGPLCTINGSLVDRPIEWSDSVGSYPRIPPGLLEVLS